MELALGIVTRCLLAVLPCDITQITGPTMEPEIYAVCPKVDYETTQTSNPWKDDLHLRRMIIKENTDITGQEHTVILYLGCPKNGT